ncbi:MAG TPA: CsgG/HfaB family protein [Mucilaginibacter sp.]|jgi:curli biogenesis system outer membrane secretion channel CsgG|nr:CsgG/HfaB family protein [Mucilaginibacter sp.]
MKKLIILCLFFLNLQALFAQKKVAVSFDAVKEECKDLPAEKRVRITVARFSVTTDAPHELGGNMASMLTNALQGVNCYRVLESLKDSSDMNDEIKYGQSSYVNKASSAKKGKQLGAQVIVTGEITEYNVKHSGIGISLVSVGSNKVHLGFVLKMINPETREVIFSKAINVDGKASGGTSIHPFGLNMVSTQNSDPALANALEQGIIQAVEFLASKKDELQLPDPNNGLANANGVNDTQITLDNANYTSFNTMTAILNSISIFKSMEKSLSSGTASFTVSHTGNDDDLLNEINKKIGGKFEVIGFGQGKIELKVK